ncbi:MAG: hypothetical protein IPJ77_19380 [Planctomycetes bacterium]|nr:hypothetical protein [Planctomycetota bacterium]
MSFPSCCLLVTPPRAADYLDVGFRTPEQTFRSFQVGWRADEPDLEHRCLSRGFRSRQQVSRLNYREFRAHLLADEPLLRIGVADARPTAPADVRGDRARLVLETHGRKLEVLFVLDDYAEVWAGGERVLDDYLPFDTHTQVTPTDAGGQRLWGHVDLPSDARVTGLSELRLGREWKIDDLRLVPASE